jgi:hypothetical protein
VSLTKLSIADGYLPLLGVVKTRLAKTGEEQQTQMLSQKAVLFSEKSFGERIR